MQPTSCTRLCIRVYVCSYVCTYVSVVWQYDGVLCKLTVADTLISSVKCVGRVGVAEATGPGWPLAGAIYSTSQG